MYGLLVSALGFIFQWALKNVILKWAFFALLWFGIAELLKLLLALLPSWFSPAGLAGNVAVFTPGLWYFIDYFRVQDGIGIALSAIAARFMIRRIPFIG